MKGRSLTEIVLFNMMRFVSFFLVIAAVVTTTLLIFMRGMEIDIEVLSNNAKLTLVHLIVLTLFGCGMDAFRRHQTIDRPLKRILDALEQITKGNFDVRLDVNSKDVNRAGFQDISRGINRLAEELASVETLRTDFIASVSHELKTPLAGVRNYATLLRDPNLPLEKRQEYAAAISTTTRRLADLVSNILKLNKLENQQIFPEARKFDLAEQLGESLLEFETAWEEKKLELDCDLADDVLVESDPELLSLVWANLISNAIKFTEPGGSITVRLTADESWAAVSVSDTGCGMTAETGAHIFEKFYQGDTAHATQGNGLGLALVKRVMDITRGSISVSSTPGKGSTFTVKLRRAGDGTD